MLSVSDILAISSSVNAACDFVAEIDSNSNYLYLGNGKPGAEYEDYSWQIKKFKIASDNSTPIEGRFADGSPSFDKQWSNRSKYNYKGV